MNRKHKGIRRRLAKSKAGSQQRSQQRHRRQQPPVQEIAVDPDTPLNVQYCMWKQPNVVDECYEEILDHAAEQGRELFSEDPDAHSIVVGGPLAGGHPEDIFFMLKRAHPPKSEGGPPYVTFAPIVLRQETIDAMFRIAMKINRERREQQVELDNGNNTEDPDYAEA